MYDQLDQMPDMTELEDRPGQTRRTGQAPRRRTTGDRAG